MTNVGHRSLHIYLYMQGVLSDSALTALQSRAVVEVGMHIARRHLGARYGGLWSKLGLAVGVENYWLSNRVPASGAALSDGASSNIGLVYLANLGVRLGFN
jgi:hypothetical protein